VPTDVERFRILARYAGQTHEPDQSDPINWFGFSKNHQKSSVEGRDALILVAARVIEQ